MAALSPCRRADSTMPSSDHSIMRKAIARPPVRRARQENERWTPCPAENDGLRECRPGESRGPYSSGLWLWGPAFAGPPILGASGLCDETERWTPCQAGTTVRRWLSGARPWKLLCRDLGCEALRARGERCSALPHRGWFEKDRSAALFSENAKQPHVKEVNAA